MVPSYSPPDLETGSFTTPAGVSLGYQRIGRGPPIILSNGAGGTFVTWRYLLEFFKDRFQIISWDYRGLYSSPPPQNRKAVQIPHHVDDLEALLDHFQISEAVFAGWSMGVQVNFELYRRRPEAFAGLAILNGTAGSPFRTLPAGSCIHRLIPAILLEVGKIANSFSTPLQLLGRQQATLTVLKRLGIVAPTLDNEVFGELLLGITGLDLELYLDILRGLGEHDAWDILPAIRCPTAVISSEHDILTPPDTAQQIADLIPNATLKILGGCTHYGAVEAPAGYNQGLNDLLDRVKWTS